MQSVWHCFEDPDYFNMWCVTPVKSTSHESKRFYLPHEEAVKLVTLLNSYHLALIMTGSKHSESIAEKLAQ